MVCKEGGVTAAKGFTAAGVHCGVKTRQPGGPWDRYFEGKNDLALIVSSCDASAAGIFTKNVVKAAPVMLDKELLEKGVSRAIVANSGNANACAPESMENARRMGIAAAKAIGTEIEKVLVGSTGVIGKRLNIEAVEAGIPVAASVLSVKGSDAAANAIMTTDTVKKETAVSFKLGETEVTIGAIAKGSGMIHPNMGTMLCYITTDCAITAPLLKKALLTAADASFHRISVDGDTSTNDSCIILANGMAGNDIIAEEGPDFSSFSEALKTVCIALAKKMAADGEGAKHLITCRVSGAANESQASVIAKSIIGSSLVKTAIFGEDANWGRVLCAMGYSGETFDPEKADVAFSSAAGRIPVCEAGRGLDFDEDLAKKVLHEKEIVIEVKIDEGAASSTAWGCDLSYDYVKINGDYRT